MGNQVSYQGTMQLREKYDYIMKSHSFAEVLISSEKASSFLWKNKKFIPSDEFATLMNSQIEASINEEFRAKFRMEVFNALMTYSPLECESTEQLVDIYLQDAKICIDLAREYAYVRSYNATLDEEEKFFWEDICNTREDRKFVEKLNTWNPNWKTKICN
jgi:hypothetical protein